MPVVPATFQDLGRFVINPNDLFITPDAIVEHSCAALKKLTDIKPEGVLDPGCGTGKWGEAVKKLWPDSYRSGIDLCIQVPDNATRLVYQTVWQGDYLTVGKGVQDIDLIIGNPPYSSKEDRNLAEKFIRKSLELLKPEGYLGFLLKTEYLASLQRVALFKEFPPKYMIQYVPRIHWEGFQFSNTIEYAFFIWQKDCKDRTQIYWLNWRAKELELY